MRIYQNDYVTVDFEKENNLFYFKWLSSTEDLSEEGYKKTMQIYIEKIKEYNPLRALIDDRDMKFVIVPELQTWISETLFPASLEAGMRLFAIVVSHDFISQLGTEQTVDENPHPDKLTSSFFQTVEEARNWLMTHDL